MISSGLDASLDEQPRDGWWYRLSSGVVMVGAGIGWTSAILACCVAAPISLAIGRRDQAAADAHDDL